MSPEASTGLSLGRALKRFRSGVWSQGFSRIIGFKTWDFVIPAGLTVAIALLDAANLLLLIPLLSSLGGAETPELVVRQWPSLDPDQYFLILIALLLLAGLAKSSLSYALHIFDARTYSRWSAKLADFFFGCYLDFGKGFFQANSQAQIWELLEKRHALIQLFLGVQRLVLNSVLLLTHLTLLVLISWPLTLALLALIPIVYGILQWEMRRASKRTGVISQLTGSLYPEAHRVFSNLDLYRITCQEDQAKEKLSQINERIAKASVESWKLTGSVERLREVLSFFCLAILIIFMSRVVLEQPSQLLTYLVFFFVVKNSLPLIGTYQQVALDFEEKLPPAEELCATLLQGLTYQVPQGHEEFMGLKEQLQFHNLEFQYNDGVKAINGLNLTLRRGTSTAIVGESGAGKSTLVELLCCHYQVPEGSILLDGRDLRQFSHRSVRSQLAVVGQDAMLFSGSLRENLCFGSQHPVSQEQLRAVLQKVRLWDWVNELPAGLDTAVGDRGLTLSAGQRQRVSICRALLRKASLYLIDEATSALDRKTQMEITDVLREATQNETVLFIAHQLDTVVWCDAIAVMSHGKIVQYGSFKALMDQEGPFKELWESRPKSCSESPKDQ